MQSSKVIRYQEGMNKRQDVMYYSTALKYKRALH